MKINHQDQVAVMFRYNNFDDIVLYTVQYYCKIEKEGASEHFFDRNKGANQDENVAGADKTNQEVPHQLIVEATGHTNFDANNIAKIQKFVETDDDKMPLQENLTPTTTASSTIFATEWGHTGICTRKLATNINNAEPQLHVQFKFFKARIV